MPRGFVFITGSERCLLSHPDSISSQWLINIQSCLLDCLWPCALNDSTGPALHPAPLILAESLCTVPCLAPGMPSPQGDFPHLYQTGVRLGLSSRRKVVRTDASNLGLGGTVRGQSGIQLLVQPGAKPTHQLPRNEGRFSQPKNLSASLKGAPHPCPFRQHDGGSLYKTPSSGHGPSTAGVPKLFHSMTHLDKYNLFHDPPKYLRSKNYLHYFKLNLLKVLYGRN